MATHPVGSRRSRGLRSESGAEIVEFALASTLFFMTIFGTISFATAAYRYNTVAAVAQDAARRASVCGKSRVLSATNCDISNFVSGRMPGASATTSPSTISALTQGQTVTVTVTYPFSPITSFVPTAAMSLRSTAAIIVAR
jgi:Flp pilus assembly protein TadG